MQIKGAAGRGLAILMAGALCLGLLSGCGAGPASSAASSAAESAAMGTGTILDDGRLRLLYGSSGLSTVFCGAEPVYTSVQGGTAYLLTDGAQTTPSGRWFVAGEPSGADAYQYTVYDETGKSVYACPDGMRPISLAGDWLLLRSGEGEQGDDDEQPGGTFVNLTTGETRAAPDYTQAFFSVTDDMLCISSVNWNTSSGVPDAQSLFCDTNLQTLQTLDATYAYPEAFLPTGWVTLTQYLGTDASGSATTNSCLYRPADGKLYDQNATACGVHYLQQSTSAGWAVTDIDTGETVGTFDTSCLWYAGGTALLDAAGSLEDGPSWYQLRRSDGTTAAVRAYSMDLDRGLAVLLTDSAEAYSSEGQLQYALPLTLGAADSGTYYNLALIGGGQFLLSTSSTPSDANTCLWYGADGLIRDLTADGYSYAFPLYGTNLVQAVRSDLPSLSDVLGPDGNSIFSGVRSITADYSGAEDLFAVQRGFTEGWMDAQGNWLWSRSVWQCTDEENNNRYAG
jgi:hypothetical protein